MAAPLARLGRRLSSIAGAISTVGAVLAALAFLFMSGLLVTEVVLRSSVGGSTLVASEYSGYAMAAMIYLSLAFTFREGAHIRVAFLNDRLPERARHWVDFALTLMAATIAVYATRAVWAMVETSYRRGTVAYTAAETPLYIPQAIILVGLILLVVQLVIQAIVMALPAGSPAGAAGEAR